jgi:hypothetical protein
MSYTDRLLLPIAFAASIALIDNIPPGTSVLMVMLIILDNRLATVRASLDRKKALD